MITIREKFLTLVDNDCIIKSDAIILLEGDGINRCSEAIRLINSGMAEKIIFSGGITDYTYGSYPFAKIKPILIENGIDESVIINEDKSQNTREQAIEVIQIAKKNNWKKLILVASHYHQYRAYLTFLKVILNSDIVLFNSPARNLNWFTQTGWGVRFNLLDLEFERIEKYTELSHLATFEEAIEYQKWKEQQILMMLN